MPHTLKEDGMKKPLALFGGEEGWSAEEWTASDDSVRGGKSKSHLSCTDEEARFYGVLDIETLGGAGFASQRTKSDDLELDLSEYVGIQICVKKADKKRYTFLIKDDLLPPDEESGREKSTISWECDFVLPPEGEPDDTYDKSVFIPWDAFTPTYRGKPQEDVEELDLKHIKRFSIMNRSFFGAQSGSFSLTLSSICALSQTPPPTTSPLDIAKLSPSTRADQKIDIRALEDGTGATVAQPKASFFASASFLRKIDRRRVGWFVVGLVAVCVLWVRFGDWVGGSG